MSYLDSYLAFEDIISHKNMHLSCKQYKQCIMQKNTTKYVKLIIIYVTKSMHRNLIVLAGSEHYEHIVKI